MQDIYTRGVMVSVVAEECGYFMAASYIMKQWVDPRDPAWSSVLASVEPVLAHLGIDQAPLELGIEPVVLCLSGKQHPGDPRVCRVSHGSSIAR